MNLDGVLCDSRDKKTFWVHGWLASATCGVPISCSNVLCTNLVLPDTSLPVLLIGCETSTCAVTMALNVCTFSVGRSSWKQDETKLCYLQHALPVYSLSWLRLPFPVELIEKLLFQTYLLDRLQTACSAGPQGNIAFRKFAIFRATEPTRACVKVSQTICEWCCCSRICSLVVLLVVLWKSSALSLEPRVRSFTSWWIVIVMV